MTEKTLAVAIFYVLGYGFPATTVNLTLKPLPTHSLPQSKFAIYTPSWFVNKLQPPSRMIITVCSLFFQVEMSAIFYILALSEGDMFKS